MANNDTLKGIGVVGNTPTTVTANGSVLEPVPAIEWTPEELSAIRAIARSMSTDRKPVSSTEVVQEIRKALATKAKTTFYTPFETEWKNHTKVCSRTNKVVEGTETEYMHKYVPASGWKAMTDLGCKLAVLPPKQNPASKPAVVDTPEVLASVLKAVDESSKLTEEEFHQRIVPSTKPTQASK
jgi:hypothetical protein